MTAQLSPERAGRITASRVAAILGVGRYGSRDEVMREMVRQHFGAEPEFAGNDATEWGNQHEEDARAAYETATGELVLDAQDFVRHPSLDWLGVSPDGLVGAEGLVEIKCPMRARYASAAEVPHYVAQMQLQMECTGRAWTDFVIWRSFDQADRLGVEPLIIERVPRDLSWLSTHLPALEAFHDEYERIIADPVLAEPFLADPDRTDADWKAAAAEFHEADAALDAAGKRMDLAKARLKELAGERSARGAGVQVIRTERAGTVDYRRVVEKHIPDVDLADFRKPGSTVITVRGAS